MTSPSLGHDKIQQKGGGGEKEKPVETLAKHMKGPVDPSVYRVYLALAFPETGSTELEDEEKLLEDMRKREKERLRL